MHIIEYLYGEGPPFRFKKESEIHQYLSSLDLKLSNPSRFRKSALENLEKEGFVYRDLVRREKEEQYKITDAGATWYLLEKERQNLRVSQELQGLRETVDKIFATYRRSGRLPIYYIPYIGMKPCQLLPNVRWLVEDGYFPSLIIPIINKPVDETTEVLSEYQKELWSKFKEQVEKIFKELGAPLFHSTNPYEINTVDFFECLKDLVKLFVILPSTREKCLIYVDITDCPKIFMNTMHLITPFYQNIFLVFMPYPKPSKKITSKKDLLKEYGDPFEKIKHPEKPTVLRPIVFPQNKKKRTLC